MAMIPFALLVPLPPVSYSNFRVKEGKGFRRALRCRMVQKICQRASVTYQLFLFISSMAKESADDHMIALKCSH
jgi:hypothetical protein